MPTEKNESPPSTLTALGRGLDVTQGEGIEKLGPAIFGVVYLVMLAAPIFFDIPNQDAYNVLLGVIGPLGYSWITKLGAQLRR